MIELFQRFVDRAAGVAENLDDQLAGRELVSAAMSLAKVGVKFVVAVGAAIRAERSLLPVFESIAVEAPVLWAELSEAMPSFADLLLDSETWETSIVDIVESEQWKSTVSVGSQLIESLVSDGIDILMSAPDATQNLSDKFAVVESALDEVIDRYLKPRL